MRILSVGIVRASHDSCNNAVGCQHPELAVLRVDEHVCQDWHRVLALDNALEQLQLSQKFSLPDHELGLIRFGGQVG